MAKGPQIRENPTDATEIRHHTLDSLCDELVSGRAVVNDSGHEFRLASRRTRALFAWYRRNRDKWSGQNRKPDVEELADNLHVRPPLRPSTVFDVGSAERRVFHLRTLRAHRFAGLHQYGTPDAAPDDLVVPFCSSVTVIEGANGSGKTSLLSAICWCLTGDVFRSQRRPERADHPIEVETVDSAAGESSCKAAMSVITPMPGGDVLQCLNGGPVPQDTWVELKFVDDAGQAITVRRELKLTARGKISVSDPDLSALGLAPIALQIGTRMPGLLPHIELDKESDLGSAVAELTGIRPLVDLARHAEKSVEKLNKALVSDRNAEIADIDAEYAQAASELVGLMEDNPEVRPDVQIPAAGPDRNLSRELRAIRVHFESVQADVLEEARSVLGETFDPKDGEARRDLMKNVGRALGQLDPNNLGRLQSASRLRGLRDLTEDKLTKAALLLEQLTAEAVELAGLAAKPERAPRLRLYVRVADWMKKHDRASLEKCPVCGGDLAERHDPITEQSVAKHLEQCLARDMGFMGELPGDWELAARAALSENAAPALVDELDRDLPAKPTELIRKALSEELFKAECFSGSLATLQQDVQKLCDEALSKLQPLEEPDAEDLPKLFSRDENGLDSRLKRIKRALAFARWRSANDEDCGRAFRRIVGIAQSEGEAPPKGSLLARLQALNELVTKADPLSRAIGIVRKLRDKTARRRRKERRLKLYSETAEALGPLVELRALVANQVNALMGRLQKAMAKWKKRMYSAACTTAPVVCDADVVGNGALSLKARANGARTSARHISNASDLRATLLAFLLAFREYLLIERGGLSILLLDDVHELFDRSNRDKLASTIPEIAGSDGRLIVTTNDPAFAGRVATAGGQQADGGLVDCRCLHALNPVRGCVRLSAAVNVLHRKRAEFEKPENVDQPQPAREYVNELRIYIEARLEDLLDNESGSLSSKPTAGELLDAVRSRRTAGDEAFSGQAFERLLAATPLAQNSRFLVLLHKSHHGRAEEITYGDVYDVKGDCIHVRELVDDAYRDYDRWMRRVPIEALPSRPTAPNPIRMPRFHVPVVEDIAAFTAGQATSELIETADGLDESMLADVAMYYINTHNFGFAAPHGCIALTRVSDGSVDDGDLVIALHGKRVYARRLLRNEKRPDIVVLGSEAEDPTSRPGSLVLPASEVRLLRVTGILFSNEPDWSRSSEEAHPVDQSALFESVRLAYRVTGESALPLAIKGQVLLGGDKVLPDRLGDHENTLVAVDTTDEAFFKRVGKPIPAIPHARFFESVGGRGDSTLVRTEDVADSLGDTAVLRSARRVVGILYEPSRTR